MTQKRRTPLLTRLILAIFNLYALGMIVGLTLRLLIGERMIDGNRITQHFFEGSFAPIGVFNSLIPPLLLPALVIFPLCLLLRRPRYALLQLPVLLVFIANYGMMFLPRNTQVQAADDTVHLSVLTYNIWVGAQDFAPMIEIIKNADADVVAFQELTDSGWAAFKTALSTAYPYQAIHSGGNSTQGMGVISRYPILEETMWEDGHFQQRVILQVEDRQVTLFNVHPPVPMFYGANSTVRDAVRTRILAQTAQAPKPVLLVGDFNMGDFSEAYWGYFKPHLTDDAEKIR